ncbi:MAG: hypothetical protein AAFV77_07395 [Planctomycetota bacterium]
MAPLQELDFAEFLEDFGPSMESGGVRSYAARGERGTIVHMVRVKDEEWCVVEILGPIVNGWGPTVALVDVPARLLKKAERDERAIDHG